MRSTATSRHQHSASFLAPTLSTNQAQNPVQRLRPPLKWAGGKRWPVPHLLPLWEGHRNRHLVEPFCGGLAVTPGLNPEEALLNDVNPHLVNFEILRRSVRYLMAVEQVKLKTKQYNLTDEQKGQLRERAATEKAAAESAFLKLYTEIWLPRSEDGRAGIETVAVGGRPLQTRLSEKKEAMIHERVMELLTTVQPRVFASLKPGRDRSRLGFHHDAPGHPATHTGSGSQPKRNSSDRPGGHAGRRKSRE